MQWEWLLLLRYRQARQLQRSLYLKITLLAQPKLLLLLPRLEAYPRVVQLIISEFLMARPVLGLEVLAELLGMALADQGQLEVLLSSVLLL